MTENIKFNELHTANKRKYLKKRFKQAADLSKLIKDEAPSEICPVCKSNEIKAYRDYFGYKMDHCLMCMAIFTNPMPSQEQLKFFYNSEYKQFENEYFIESWEARKQIYKARVAEINRLDIQTIFDVGSGVGIFLDALNTFSNQKHRIIACDISVDACRKLAEKYPTVEIKCSNILDIQISEKVDAVTLWDSLEHITQPDILLKKLAEMTRKGGYLFISTPNTKSFEWLTADKTHIQLLPPGHVCLYNTKNISILLERQGYKVENIITPNGTLDVQYIKSRIVEKYIKARLGEFLRVAIEDMSFERLFAKLISETKFGGNQFVIARKK